MGSESFPRERVPRASPCRGRRARRRPCPRTPSSGAGTAGAGVSGCGEARGRGHGAGCWAAEGLGGPGVAGKAPLCGTGPLPGLAAGAGEAGLHRVKATVIQGPWGLAHCRAREAQV